MTTKQFKSVDEMYEEPSYKLAVSILQNDNLSSEVQELAGDILRDLSSRLPKPKQCDPMPKRIPNPNLSNLFTQMENYIVLRMDHPELTFWDDTPTQLHLFQTVMETFYGPDIFKTLNHEKK